MKCRRHYMACHFRSEVPDLTFEFNLPHWVRTIGVETINGDLGDTQSVSGVLHDSIEYNAQY